jgi:hypothetical protein
MSLIGKSVEGYTNVTDPSTGLWQMTLATPW